MIQKYTRIGNVETRIGNRTAHLLSIDIIEYPYYEIRREYINK